VSGAVLAATAPILAAVGSAIAVKMGRPVVFSHARPGKDEKLFQMYKFRTMTDARGPDGEPLLDAERITPLGRFLRKTSLDELPALLNVLKGEMSLVGPRPLMVQYLPYFTDRERLRHTVRPGITGWAQIHGRNEVPWDRRLALDVWYVENHSLWLDLKILAATARMVLKREGVVVVPRSTMRNLDEERAGRQRPVGPAERA
jgi:lipopolysaccharide/colanic/teichoic acid biosynthesis glycosyltransferase